MLDVAVMRPIAIGSLLPDENDPDYFAGMFNREPHGLSARELEDLLIGMFREGLLLAWRLRQHYVMPGPNTVMPSPEEIGDALTLGAPPTGPHRTRARLFYGLSPLGAERWEALAVPDWQDYVESAEGDSSYGDRYSIERTSINPSHLADFVQRDVELYRIADPATVHRRRLRVWRATYWKSFAPAYRVRYLLWPEAELQAQGASMTCYDDLWHLEGRRRPTWYADYISKQRME